MARQPQRRPSGFGAKYLPKSYLDQFESPHRTSRTHIDVSGPSESYPKHLKSTRTIYPRRDRACLSRKSRIFRSISALYVRKPRHAPPAKPRTRAWARNGEIFLFPIFIFVEFQRLRLTFGVSALTSRLTSGVRHLPQTYLEGCSEPRLKASRSYPFAGKIGKSGT